MKKIGLLALALVLALGTMGAGIAYFSDTATEAMTFSAGEMDLQIAPDAGGDWYDTSTLAWSIGPDWAPGDITECTTYSKNAGTTGGQVFGYKVNADDYTGSWALLDNTYITGMVFTWENRYVEADIWGSWCIDLWDSDDDEEVSLREFMDSPYGPVIYYYEGGEFTGEDLLKSGGVNIEKTELKLKFNKDAGNELMNTTATINVTFRLFDGYDNVHHVGEVSPSSYGYVEME